MCVGEVGNNFRVLVVAADFVWPPNHGGRVDVWAQMTALKRLGCQVDLMFTAYERPLPDELEVVGKVATGIHFVSRLKGVGSHISSKPYQLYSRRELRRVELDFSRYDLVILESDYVLPVAKAEGFSEAACVVLRVQNREASYFAALAGAASSFRDAMFYRLEALRFLWVNRSEARLLRSMDGWVISRDECAAETRFARAHWVPPAVGEIRAPVAREGGGTVLFVGSLFMPNNVEGLRWYLDRVHPLLVREPGYRLVIAGRGGEALKQELASYDHVTMVADPSDEALDEIYQAADVFVAPMFHGAGVKLKVINALAHGMPVVATHVSNQGTGFLDGVHLDVSDVPGEFADRVRKLLADGELGRKRVLAAQDLLRERYDFARFFSQHYLVSGARGVQRAPV